MLTLALVPNPSKNVPKAIIGTVFIGFITSWTFSIAVFFTITNIDAIIYTATGVPILQVFYHALGDSAVGASVLLAFLAICLIGALMAIHTWMCRLTWSFARDNGFPFSDRLSRVAPEPYNVPINAHVFGTFWISVLGILYLVSTTAFNSLVTGGILMQYISYMIPVALLMSRGREMGRKGSFWLGRKSSTKGGALGWVSNSVLMLWGGFTCIVYSFPYLIPVAPGNMSEYKHPFVHPTPIVPAGPLLTDCRLRFCGNRIDLLIRYRILAVHRKKALQSIRNSGRGRPNTTPLNSSVS